MRTWQTLLPPSRELSMQASKRKNKPHLHRCAHHLTARACSSCPNQARQRSRVCRPLGSHSTCCVCCASSVWHRHCRCCPALVASRRFSRIRTAGAAYQSRHRRRRQSRCATTATVWRLCRCSSISVWTVRPWSLCASERHALCAAWQQRLLTMTMMRRKTRQQRHRPSRQRREPTCPSSQLCADATTTASCRVISHSISRSTSHSTSRLPRMMQKQLQLTARLRARASASSSALQVKLRRWLASIARTDVVVAAAFRGQLLDFRVHCV